MGESQLGSMFAGFAKAATKLGSQAAMIAETVTAQSRINLEYEIAAEVGQCGPEGVWKVHRARPTKAGTRKTVSVWILNKAALQQSSSSKTATTLLDADIRQTNLLKHPGVVKIIEPLEETRTQFLLVTEEVIGSLDSWLKGRCRLQVENSDTDPLSVLEIKDGLQKTAETLSFVHNSCKRVHCNISPQSIILAADGTWKLAGFGLSQAASTEELPGLASSDKEQKRFSYDYEASGILDRLGKPELAFCAPEVVSSVSEAPITGSADTFSLACVAYRVLRGQNLFTAQTTSEYRGTLASMNLLPVDGLPDSLQGVLRSMLNSTATQRPQLQSFIACSYFREDRLLRALYFLDSILQRETAQKHAFIKDLPSFLPQFPTRVLRHRVLPVLMQQWQDDALKDAVLPLVLKMVKNLPADVFQDQVLPELRIILETASGSQLLRVLAAVPELQAAMRVEQVEEVLMPLLLRGLVSADTRIQEEVLTALKEPLKRVRAECIHKKILPHLLKTCVDTKSASVRVASLQTLTGVSPRLTEQESDVCVRMIKHLTAHEASDITLTHVLELCEAINGSKSAAYAARSLLPLLSPLLTTSSMTAPTFRRYVVLLRAMLDKVEERLHPQKATSSGNGAAVTASWDDTLPAAPPAHSAASSSSAQGLGFMDNDFLSAWSTPVTSPSSTAASSTAPPSVVGQSTSTGTGMRPPAAKAALLTPSRGASGLGLLDMPLAGPTSSGMSGLGGVGHSAAMRAPPFATTDSKFNSSQLQNVGLGASIGMAGGSRLEGGGLQMAAPATTQSVPVDPFADLFGSTTNQVAGSTAQKQSNNWDPFA